ncbi:MAG: ABC transporter permease [Actinomycetaceae bacterium]|nr:ABC transporter permease [Actinomycetaceae bacterium]
MSFKSAALNRFTSTAKAGFHSSTVFATLGTSVVTLLVLPVLDVVFDILLGADLSAPDLTRIAYSGALIALTVSVCSGLVSRVAQDRSLGIFLEVHTHRRFDFSYWMGAAVVPCALAFFTGIVVIATAFISSTDHDVTLLLHVLGLALVGIVVGVMLGIFASGIALKQSNPYIGANMIASFLPIFVGVLVPVKYYPTWLQHVCHIVPMSHTIRILDGNNPSFGTIGIDLLLGVIWALAGILFVNHSVKALRNGTQQSLL